MSAAMEVREPSADSLNDLQPPLVRHFELMVTAPGGVAKLRELILTLAVRGKLVPQDPSEEPASELLKKIHAEKTQLVAEDRRKSDKPLADITDDEQPFDLPIGWKWAQLGKITTQVTDGTHQTPKYLQSGVAFISVKDIDGNTVSFADCRFISEEEHRQINARCCPERGDLLLCRIGTLGRPTLVDTDRPFSLFVSVGLLKLPKSCNISSYLHLVMRSPLLVGQYDAIKAGGSHTNKLNLGDIPRLLIPVAPLGEQTRIVTRVEELMRLCDALEAKGQLEAAQHAQLVQTLLGALTASATPEELADNWERVATHFDFLLDRPKAIDALEETILQLAVRGLLVPQDTKDEPASELLKKIRAEKERLIANGKTKRDQLVELVAPENLPQWLPCSWRWIRLSELHPEFQNGASSRGDSGGTPVTVLRLADIRDRRVSLADTREIPIAARDIEKYRISKGDILVTRVNGSADIVGQFNLCDSTYEAIYCDHFIRMRISAEWMNHAFLALLGESDLVRARIRDLFITTAGQKTVNQGHIGSLQLPLPPLAEQYRIVASVESLRRLCADLRQRLTARQTTQAHLAEALIDEVA
jgi:type I restriction enzyme S subunit